MLFFTNQLAVENINYRLNLTLSIRLDNKTKDKMDNNTLEIVIALLSAFSLMLVTLLTIQSDKIRDIKAKLSDKKYSTYNEILTILFDLINQTKGLKTI